MNNREIKFRAWDIDKNKMVFEDFGVCCTIIYPLYNKPNFNGTYRTILGEGFNGILMQYTGLKDKNGVEIYEGDIVRDGDDIFETKFQEGRFVGVMDENIILDLSEFAEDCEVIGNIYDNPELLTNKN